MAILLACPCVCFSSPPCLLACAPVLPDLHHHRPDEEGNNATRRRSLSSTRSNTARRSTHDRAVAHGPAHRSRRACLTCTSASEGPSVVIDLTRRATARGEAHQLDSIDIAAILARRRRRTRARSLCALLCASVIHAPDDGTDRGAWFARQVASRQLAYTSWLPLSQPPGWAWTKPLNSNLYSNFVLELRRDFPTSTEIEHLYSPHNHIPTSILGYSGSSSVSLI